MTNAGQYPLANDSIELKCPHRYPSSISHYSLSLDYKSGILTDIVRSRLLFSAY